MKVVLHIGANKTGSTALQRYFSQNRKTFLRQGILYPQTGLQGVAHYDLSKWLGFGHGGQALDGAALEEKRRGFHAEFARSGAELAIMSSEFFMLKRPRERVRVFFEGVDLRIIVVLRRHDSWWPSLWAQAVKTVDNPSWNRSFEGFIDFQRRKQRQHLDYRTLVATWEDFCDGGVQAIPYEVSQMPEGIVPSFLSAAGLGGMERSHPPDAQKDNVSQRIDVLSLVDFLQRTREISPNRKQALISRALACEGSGPTVGDFVSGHLKRRLALEHAEDYAFLDRRFAPPGQARFFCDPLPEDDGREGRHWLPPVPAIELLVNRVLDGG